MQELGRLGADMLVEVFNQRTLNCKSLSFTKQQIATKLNLKKFNINPNRSLLYELTAWGESRRIANYCFHNCLDVDYLHTLLKGSIEYIVTYILLILKALNRTYDKEKVSKHFKEKFFVDKKRPSKNLFCNSLTNLDMRINSFPVYQTLLPVPLSRMENISDMLKTDVSNSQQGNTTGILSGNIRATSLPGLLLAIMFSIGLNGSILPNFDIVSLDKKEYNPTQVFMLAACSSMEVVFFSHAKELEESQIDVFANIIFNSTIQLTKLYDMKQDILRQFGIVKILKEGKVDKCKAVKPHLLRHIPAQIKQYGNSAAFDTQITEISHKETSKTPWENSSKQTRGGQKEMMMIVAKREHADILNRRQLVANEIIVDITPPNIMQFSFSNQLQKNKIFSNFSFQDQHDNFMHPIVSLSTIKTKIEEYVVCSDNKNSDKILVESLVFFLKKTDKNVQLALLAGVKCNGNDALGIDPFHIRCHREYRGNHRTDLSVSVMSSLEIQWEEDIITSVLVMGILDITCYDNSHRFMLLTKHYERLPKPNKSFSLPYDLHQYDSTNTFDLINVASVHRPIFVVPSIDHETEKTTSSSVCNFLAADSLANFKRRRFYLIPFHRCNKNDQRDYEDYVQMGSTFQTVQQLEAKNKKQTVDVSDDSDDSDDEIMNWTTDIRRDDKRKNIDVF